MDIAKIRKKIKEEREAGKVKEKTQAETGLQQEESPESPAETQKAEGKDSVLEAGKQKTEKVEGTGSEAEIRDVEDQGIQSSEPQQIKTLEPKTQKESAIKETETAEVVEEVELLTFNLSTEEFAFRVSDIAEILRFQRITIVPKVPDHILGITSLRGKIIPVTDLKKRLFVNSPSSPFTSADETRKKILILKGDKGPLGALIDKVQGVIRISPSDIVEPPAHLTVAESIFIEGVVLHNNRFISVIRMEEVSNISLK